ncbi:predicted protein [Naegleria gruberi]|uniref:Predicted protein n=1 Tax=Naegleria gruberi TaxID=5762 RepID=D2VB87_NAEGR|nr:uncharacterized protein NAEGRDRAFT_66129 [Naegleria gruberi]EFC45866.1 predicted protein [Naegleria gruberi]|eukprot:XP_002678610.1 predicted protein [Naegleria gruberi strain NEG-M]
MQIQSLCNQRQFSNSLFQLIKKEDHTPPEKQLDSSLKEEEERKQTGLIKEKNSPTFLSQVYNLKNGIEAMEQQVLAYFPKSSIQMTPFFLNEMMKNPKNYYWVALLAILGTSGFLYMYYLFYYKQFVGKLIEQERFDMDSTITTLRSIQLNSSNYGSFPSLMGLNIEKLVEKLNSDEINIEVRRETLSTIYSLCRYDYFLKQLIWKRDFLSSLVDSLQVSLTSEVTKAILEKLFSSKIAMKILREECPTNFHNVIQKLMQNNQHDISLKLLYQYYDGSVEEIKKYYENRLHLDSIEAVKRLEFMKQNNESIGKLNLGENTEGNGLMKTLLARVSLVPLEVASTVVYCLYSWKKRANSPVQFNNHIKKWAIVAGLVPAVADLMVTTLLSKPFGKKVEQYYSENGSNYSGTKFSPTTIFGSDITIIVVEKS